MVEQLECVGGGVNQPIWGLWLSQQQQKKSINGLEQKWAESIYLLPGIRDLYGTIIFLVHCIFISDVSVDKNRSLLLQCHASDHS